MDYELNFTGATMKSILSTAILGLLLMAATPLIAGGPAGDKVTTAPEIRGDIAAAAQAWERIEEGALLIDVRSQEEFESGHIDGAINIPHTRIEDLVSAIGEDHTRAVVLYCGSGRRADTARKALEELGYEDVFNGTGLSALQATRP